MDAFTACGIRDLVVILNKSHKLERRHSPGRRAAPVALPFVALALIQEAVFDRGNELLRFALIIRVISFLATGDRDHGAVMIIVVPQTIQSIAASGGWADQPRILRFVLADDDRLTAAGGSTDAGGDELNDVIRRGVVDLLSGIQPQTIDVKFVDPITRVGNEKLAHRAGIMSVEINAEPQSFA